MKCCSKISCLILLILLPFIFAYSQSEKYSFEHITTKDGLTSNYTCSIFKDSRGFMWFATEMGLCRYDGFIIKVYQHNPKDSCSISGNFLWSNIIEDREGHLWVGTISNGINKLNVNTEKFTRYIVDSDNYSGYKFYIDKNQEIWIGSLYNVYNECERGLLKYNYLTNNLDCYKLRTDDKCNKANNILSIFEDSSEKLWIGTQKGVYQFNRNEKVFIDLELNCNNYQKVDSLIYYSIAEDYNKNIWFGTDVGLFKLEKDKSNSKQFDIVQKYDEATVFQIVKDPQDKGQSLWIHGYNFFKYSSLTERVEEIVEYNSDIFFLHCDNNFKWLATSNTGIHKLNSNRQNIIFNKTQTTDKEENKFAPNTFLEDFNGDLWVGTIFGGLICYDQNLKIKNWYTSFPTSDSNYYVNNIISLTQSSENFLWISCYGAGLFKLDIKENKFSHYKFCNENDSVNPIFVEKILATSNNDIWAIVEGKLYLVIENQDLSICFQNCSIDPISNSNITALYEDKFGYLWIGTSDRGLFYLSLKDNIITNLKNGNFQINDNLLIDSNIKSICEDYKGVLWISTEKGLFKFQRKKNSLERIVKWESIGISSLKKISFDKNKNVWGYSTQGLVKLNLMSRKNPILKIFRKNDGIPFEEVYQKNIYKSKRGRIFVGGIKGFYSFYPDSIKDNDRIPPIVLTQFKVKNKDYKLDSSISTIKKIILKHKENYFSFEFAALDYTNPQENKYAYFLEGLDEDWIYSGTRHFANYTGVPPGDYIFRVKGSNNDGYWNEEGTSVAITILSPPWKTWRAYTLYTIIIALLIFAWRRYDLKRLHLKQSFEIEHIEADKLKELDKMKSRFFANISHEFRTPLTLILGPLEKFKSQTSDPDSRNDLNVMQRNALRLQNLINQLLNLSRFEAGQMKLKASPENIVKLISGYVQSFESLAKKRDISLSFKSEIQNIEVYFERDKVEKILYNLLSNAFKFTDDGGNISVNITKRPPKTTDRNQESFIPSFNNGGVMIKVTDNGQGIPPKKLNFIFNRFYQVDNSFSKDQEGSGIGLALVKELVEIHHGIIDVYSEPSKGSTFIVTLPLGKDHLKAEEITSVLNIYDEVDKTPDFENKYDETQNIEAKDDQPGDNNKPLLLIVEDNDDLRAYIRSYLTNDYAILEAIDGEAGLRKTIQNIPDIVVSDVMMPKMDGIEYCQKVKKDERTSHIPVILLTAKASMEDKIEGLQTGADDFITKPFDPSELLVRIQNLISQRATLREQFIRELDITGKINSNNLVSEDKRFIQKAKKVIETNLSDFDFGVENFATEMNLSRVQLHRKLKALINQSAGDFVRTVRLNHAAQLLKSKAGNIAQIAYEVGFNNPSYFSKCFQEQFGVLPSDYNK